MTGALGAGASTIGGSTFGTVAGSCTATDGGDAGTGCGAGVAGVGNGVDGGGVGIGVFGGGVGIGVDGGSSTAETADCGS